MCPSGASKVSRDVWARCLRGASLPETALEQVREGSARDDRGYDSCVCVCAFDRLVY